MLTRNKSFLKYVLLFVLFGSLIYLCLSLLHMQSILDISMQTPTKISSLRNTHDTYLISYADGKDVFFKNQNILASSAINRGFDHIVNYSRKHIAPEYIAANPILNDPRGAGYWLWKPYIILETLNKTPDGTIIMYADTGLVIRQPIEDYFASGLSMPNKDILLFAYPPHENGLAARAASKDTFIALNCLTEECRNSHHVWAGIIVLRNSVASRKFISDWLHACEQTDLLLGVTKTENFPEFTHHQHDEGILGVLAARENAIVAFLPMDDTYRKHIHGHRRHSDDKSLLGFTSSQFSSPERRLPNWWWVKKLTAFWQK